MAQKISTLLMFCFIYFVEAAIAQNVGIGTLSPLEKLHVVGGNMRLDAPAFPVLSFYNHNSLKGFVGADSADITMGIYSAVNPNGKIFFQHKW